jgi:NAD(P)-dependent dehydrogenase (short-subunit alcohol dehydrogenase family)
MFLKDKVALISGSTGSIGSSIAYILAKNGADIILNYWSDKNSVLSENQAKKNKSYIRKNGKTRFFS